MVTPSAISSFIESSYAYTPTAPPISRKSVAMTAMSALRPMEAFVTPTFARGYRFTFTER